MKSKASVLISFTFLVVVVIASSFYSSRAWGGKPEEVPERVSLLLRPGMTVEQYGKTNSVPREVLQKIFKLKGKDELGKNVESFGIPEQELSSRVNGALAIMAEQESKNWVKIRAKFVLWIVFLAAVFVMMRKRLITAKSRMVLYFAAVLIFGVVLGADPSAMGTVKDAVVLLGARGVIFPPRLMAMTVFLGTVFFANKFFCAWGCQLGTLQDLIFRLNRNKKDAKGLLKQYRIAFAVSNSIRVVFFIAMVFAAMIWAVDIIDSIDPFKIFKPPMISLVGWVFLGAMLISSLFIYRPWCTLFCPFGLAGWLVEKISVYRISVDYDKCVACGACAKACPCYAMEAILKRDSTIPDCFACGTCIETCPVNAIKLKPGRRSSPPEGKFGEKQEAV